MPAMSFDTIKGGCRWIIIWQGGVSSRGVTVSSHNGAAFEAQKKNEIWRATGNTNGRQKWKEGRRASLFVTANSAFWGGSSFHHLNQPHPPHTPSLLPLSLVLVSFLCGDRRRGISWRIKYGSSFHRRTEGCVGKQTQAGGEGSLSSQNFTLDSKRCTFTQRYDIFKDKMGQNALW